MQRDFPLFVALATAAAIPAMAQTPSAAGPAGSEAHHAAPVPDFSRVWNHPAFPLFEPPASGSWPITNLSRWPEQRRQGEDGSGALLASKVGISNHKQLVGDYKTPILQRSAAAVVKTFDKISLAAIPLLSSFY
jgi:hypothetical protein